MTRAFASQADMAEKKITFSRLSEHAYAFTAEGDPNTGIVVGDASLVVVGRVVGARSAVRGRLGTRAVQHDHVTRRAAHCAWDRVRLRRDVRRGRWR